MGENAAVAGPYEPASYWQDRLGAELSLRTTGHHQYSEGYNRWLYRAKAHMLGRLLPSRLDGRRALDVGSGTGWVVEQLARRGAGVEGCDITDVAVERLRGRFPAASFFRLALGDEAIPRADASYDVVTLLDVAYHVVDDDRWRAGVRELARVLRPGGTLVATDRLGADDDRPAEHVHFRGRRAWSEVADEAGLRLGPVVPYCRWLSRDPGAAGFRRLPERLRGPIEYALERVAPRPPHLRGFVLIRPEAQDPVQAPPNTRDAS